MHPILGNLRRLALYLLAWVPLSAMLLYLLASIGELSWPEALVLFGPPCLLYPFMCLSCWYSCRATPLERSGFLRLAITHLFAAAFVSNVWVWTARGYIYLISSTQAYSGIGSKASRDYDLLFASGVMLYLLAVALHYVLLSVENSREAERREQEARVLARDSELKALKAQINPHFLFNSLNSISALTSIDGARARDMCVLLADFLRKTLGMGEKIAIPLRDELALIHAFLAVEKIRFGARLRFDENVDQSTLECVVPPLLLQPLVENAVAHGISNLTEGGFIRLNIKSLQPPQPQPGSRDAQPDAAPPSSCDLVISVENNFDPEMPRRRGNSMGLRNVRQRLHTRYGDLARFEVRAEGEIFRVSLRLPGEAQSDSAGALPPPEAAAQPVSH